MFRCEEPGWIRVTRMDSAGRRAMWLRVSDDLVELCAGRNGDDEYVSIPRHHAEMTMADLRALRAVADSPLWFLGIEDCEGW